MTNSIYAPQSFSGRFALIILHHIETVAILA
jgi:hypothetical protein